MGNFATMHYYFGKSFIVTQSVFILQQKLITALNSSEYSPWSAFLSFSFDYLRYFELVVLFPCCISILVKVWTITKKNSIIL